MKIVLFVGRKWSQMKIWQYEKNAKVGKIHKNKYSLSSKPKENDADTWISGEFAF